MKIFKFTKWILMAGVLSPLGSMVTSSPAQGAICDCGAPPSCGPQPAFCYREPDEPIDLETSLVFDQAYVSAEDIANNTEYPMEMVFFADGRVSYGSAVSGRPNGVYSWDFDARAGEVIVHFRGLNQNRSSRALYRFAEASAGRVLVSVTGDRVLVLTP